MIRSCMHDSDTWNTKKCSHFLYNIVAINVIIVVTFCRLLAVASDNYLWRCSAGMVAGAGMAMKGGGESQ